MSLWGRELQLDGLFKSLDATDACSRRIDGTPFFAGQFLSKTAGIEELLQVIHDVGRIS